MRRAVSVLLLLAAAGCHSPPATTPAPPAPFAFDVLTVDKSINAPYGPQVEVRLRTSADTARAASEQDLRELLAHLAAAIDQRLDEVIADNASNRWAGGDRRVFVYLYLVEGGQPWAHVSRLEGRVDVMLTPYQVPEIQ